MKAGLLLVFVLTVAVLAAVRLANYKSITPKPQHATTPSMPAVEPIRKASMRTAGDATAEPESHSVRKSSQDAESVKKTLAAMRGKNADQDPNAQVETAAQERSARLDDLVKQLRDNPDTMAPLLEQLWAENDEELIGLVVEAIIRSTDKTAAKLPADELLKHAKSDSSPARRAAALRLLSRIPTLNPSTLQTVTELARTDPDKGIKISAVSTLNSWMIFHRDQGEKIAGELVQVRDSSEDAMIRGITIQAVANQDLPLQGALLDAMLTSLKEPIPMNRALAALGLARGATEETRPKILRELTAAFERESEMYVKRNMIGMMVLGGAMNAVDDLLKIQENSSDPLLQQDAKDYLELLVSGETDMEKVIGLKELRDDERGTTNHIPEEQFHAAN